MGSGNSTPRSTRSLPAGNSNKNNNVPRQKRRPHTEAKFRFSEDDASKEPMEYVSGSAEWNLEQVLLGNPKVQCKSNIKIVRIFTSSTFTDTRHERNALMEKVFPSLKTFCKDLGYDFQVVDMRWGVREEALDDHRTTELCMAEIEECKKVSTGPNFVTLLSHKYGFRPFPRTIPSEDFETIVAHISPEERTVIDFWFRLDENAIPSEYVLQPVSKLIPAFLSKDVQEKEVAVTKWWQTFELLQQLISDGARRCLPKEKIHDYVMSVTEREITEGILQVPDAEKHCLWFKRTIVDIDEAPTSHVLGRYLERENREEATKDARNLMEQLREKRIPSKLPKTNILEYAVHWSDHGIDPEKDDEHEAYISMLCDDFLARLKKMIITGIKERAKTEINSELYAEVVQQITFARSRCKLFSGQDSLLEKVGTYVIGDSDQPLVLHGGSGSGKTSIMAVITQRASSWLGSSSRGVATVFRFLGTTRASSSLRPLLLSLTEQISRIYGQNFIPKTTLKAMVEDFKTCLGYAKSALPLVLVLDSLDQLDAADGGRYLHWLPRQLPPNVKLVLSTLPGEQYQAYQSCLGLYRKQSSYLEVTPLEEADLIAILDKWLLQARRCLTQRQRTVLLDALRAQPLPLYLKLSFDEARRWHSYDHTGARGPQLGDTISTVIHELLWGVERQHGRLLVSQALGCLTAAKKGLTEGEIEDLLSLSDEVLNDVYQFWTPPIRRLPPLLWVRVRQQLQEYLVNRGVDGVQVIYWYHRQFIEVATERYLDTADERFRYHLALAEYFLGIWADRPKPYVNDKGQQTAALRYVAKQPLQFENGDYNLRMLMQVPYHMIQARELKTLKSQALCNYEFLVAKLKATSYTDVLHDLKEARTAFPDDQDLQVVTETLQLSQEALVSDAYELASQLVGRIHGTGSSSLLDQARAMMDMGTLPEEAVPLLSLLEAFEEHHEQRSQALTKLLEQAHKPSKVTLLPNRGFLVPPGGQLLYQMASPTERIIDIDISENGKIAFSGHDNGTVKLWDLMEGEMNRSLELPAGGVGFVRFLTDDQNVLASCWGGKVFLIDVQLGLVQAEYAAVDARKEMCMPITVCTNQNNEEFLICMRNQEIDIWDVANVRKICSGPVGYTDWGTGNKRSLDLSNRILLSHKQFFLYAPFRGWRYFVLSVDDQRYVQTVRVFGEYDFDQRSKAPDFAPDDHDHISAMALTGDASAVIVANGANGKLHLFDFGEGRQIRVVQPPGGAGISRLGNFYLRQDSEWLYYTQGVNVGVWSLKSNEHHVGLRHPCRLQRVIGVDGRFIVTIGEDSVMRVWDRAKPPFEQDMSSFTGKAKLGDDDEAGAVQAQFDEMFSGIVGSDVAAKFNTKNLLTSEETPNYWTPAKGKFPGHAQVHLKVHSRLFPFENAKYIVVVQDDVSDEYSVCLSVWDTQFMSCVRRTFLPPGAVYVHTVYGDNTAVISENRKLKLLDLRRFNVYQVLQGMTFDLRPPFVVYIPKRQELVTETRGGRYLKVYNPMEGTMVGELIPSTASVPQYLASTTFPKVQLKGIQASPDGSVLAALYTSGTPTIFLWNLETRKLIYAVNSRSIFPGIRDESIHFHMSSCSQFMVVQKESLTCKQPQAEDVSIINTKTGKPFGHAVFPKDESMDTSDLQKICLIRTLSKSYVEMIGIADNGKAYILDYKETGPHANRVVTSPEGLHVVTWCDTPQEKTLRYWHFDRELQFIGSFTPDNELADVVLHEHGNTLFIDSTAGLIRLQLQSRSQPAPTLNTTDSTANLYQGIDLDISFPIGGDEDLIDDDDDPDEDTDFVQSKTVRKS